LVLFCTSERDLLLLPFFFAKFEFLLCWRKCPRSNGYFLFIVDFHGPVKSYIWAQKLWQGLFIEIFFPP
jgi:hypothetical protein